ncbi:bifunctional demethylmenaquinone methyltransferase/2-methoxy-6-polyprenyl-1,4-benzoquinol methylase UbiE [Pseudobacteriovorax antillogorgiicola]|uniref:Demethylmenaquinone methyltransferase n=1 Tax=Pseudobacteriovorax antillogorgiicola TaxID=1513793 RepID=A0A1Y6BAL1_9BACT|nr:bifunctional demethylmenaquinone methyltransferase/2-methoxy-6-polyprenyl-1,4-benzoquinol methylase UbiE [Pseudobacteriovorax antillogorgiicola]TCS58891.1 demethylmenaquinone methyltransferase/2-methoxy-6-polyprenyl-1,4-benzoquinol methylase [Pseudobacteriovorax antillogorgiicola]SME93541.1 demethylmenaquinone methyltransferase / 2-methoxy-6-polyprenyl-1,4-benzoquinol methylase [Pseudobacteriovorax antillogorgiicola]
MSLSHSKTESFKLFNEIAGRYDLINSVLSFGLHYQWRRLIRKTLPRRNNIKVLDLATGTGDVALELVKAPQVSRVDGLDMSIGMVEKGRRKVQAKNLKQKIDLKVGDAQALPFPDNAYDAITISFGIRNIPDVPLCLEECYRVLRPGGRLIVLEFALPSSKLVRAGHLFYLRNILPKIGKALSGHEVAYKYLNETIEDFPFGERFTKLMADSGLENNRFEELTGGIVNIYWGDKN